MPDDPQARHAGEAGGLADGLTAAEVAGLWRLALELQACRSLAEAETVATAARAACDSPAVVPAVEATIEAALNCLRERDRLQTLATRDPLTGLANRRVMEEALDLHIAESARLARPLAVGLIDLDRFRDYNRRHGHLAGDAALRTLAMLFAEVEREADVACRSGGDEFVIVMPSTTPAEARARLEPLSRRLADRAAAAAARLPEPVTVSVGIAASPADGAVPAALLAAADAAMYRAKQAGGDRICLAGDQPAG